MQVRPNLHNSPQLKQKKAAAIRTMADGLNIITSRFLAVEVKIDFSIEYQLNGYVCYPSHIISLFFVLTKQLKQVTFS